MQTKVFFQQNYRTIIDKVIKIPLVLIEESKKELLIVNVKKKKKKIKQFIKIHEKICIIYVTKNILFDSLTTNINYYVIIRLRSPAYITYITSECNKEEEERNMTNKKKIIRKKYFRGYFYWNEKE